MDSTHIDYLLQLPLPRPEGGLAPSRSRDDGPPFERHFQQASDASYAGEPTPVRTTVASSDSQPRPSSEGQRPPAPPAAQETRPADEVQESHDAASADEHNVDEAKSEDVAVAAAQVQSQPTSDAPATDESTADTSKPVEATVEPQAKPSRKTAAAAKQNSANRAIPGDASISLDADTAVEATQEVSPAAVEEAAADGVQPAKQVAVAPSTETSEAVKASADVVEVSTEEVATTDQPADAQPTRKSPRSTPASATATDAAAAKTTTDEPAKRTDKHSAEQVATATATEPATSTAATDELPDVPADTTTVVEREPANVESDPAGEDESTALGQRPAVAARATASQPVAVAASAAPVAADNVASQNTSPDSATKTKKIGGDAKESVLTTFARFERNTALGSRGLHHSGESQATPHVDPARFVSRVARAIQTAQDRGAPLLLRLSPPELGSLRLELSVQHGMLSATVEADNQNARQLLLENLPALRDRLADQNIRIERFDVDVRRDGEGREQPNFNPQQHRDPQNSKSPHRPGTNRGHSAEEAVDTTPIVPQAITNTSINVVA